MIRSALILILALLGVPEERPDEKPLEQQGYLGLLVRDIPGEHTVVSWILPGPLEGEGLTCPAHDLARADLLVSVDGRRLGADAFKAYVRSRAPGESIRLGVRTSNTRGGRIPDTLDHEEEVREITVTLGSRDHWTGTIHRGRAFDVDVAFDGPALLDPADPANPLGAAIAAEGLAEPLDLLLGTFAKWQDDAPDHHALSRVRASFDAPFRMPELASLMTRVPRTMPVEPVASSWRLIRDNLDISDWKPGDTELPDRLGTVVDAGRFALTRATDDVRAALGPRWRDEAFAARCFELLRVPRRTFYITGPEAESHIGVIRASMDVDFALLLRAFQHASLVTAVDASRMPEATPGPPPAALEGIVTGDILAAEDLGADIGWIVVGSEASNTYDLTRIAAVFDPGGNDQYTASGLRPGARTIVDLAGNDRYSGTPEQGPGAALLGVCIIDDRGGDDRYEGQLLSAGAACFGMSLLLDREGADVYVGTEWSQGAACYGAGLIVDLGFGNDTYQGEFLSQGVGGPRGLGCIIDEHGRDLYRINGPEGSAYGTAAVFQSFGQGLGFGYRQYAAGGIGMISDLGGDDRYEAGEFAQGGAYYFGLGVLHDAAGRDLYYGNRYGQGFGVHQAHGMLVDDAGDDTYWSMTAASQGAGWDIGAGLLLDRAGNDTYQCDGLGQGGAAQQAIGMLVDLGGIDRYVAGGGATQGQSGGNAYHFAQTGARSFSLLLDLGGATDFYSRDRPNNATIATGSANTGDPAASRLHGLAIDR